MQQPPLYLFAEDSGLWNCPTQAIQGLNGAPGD